MPHVNLHDCRTEERRRSCHVNHSSVVIFEIRNSAFIGLSSGALFGSASVPTRDQPWRIPGIFKLDKLLHKAEEATGI